MVSNLINYENPFNEKCVKFSARYSIQYISNKESSVPNKYLHIVQIDINWYCPRKIALIK